jgi:hypothetical protein
LVVWLVELSGLAVRKPVRWGSRPDCCTGQFDNLIISCPFSLLTPFLCLLSNIAVFVGLDWILLGCVGMEVEMEVEGDA